MNDRIREIINHLYRCGLGSTICVKNYTTFFGPRTCVVCCLHVGDRFENMAELISAISNCLRKLNVRIENPRGGIITIYPA